MTVAILPMFAGDAPALDADAPRLKCSCLVVCFFSGADRNVIAGAEMESWAGRR